MDKLSYALGLGIGQQLKQMGLRGTLKIEDFATSITDVLNDNPLKVSHQEGQQIVNTFFQELEQKQNAAKAAAGKAAKEEGTKFLAENANKAGITVTKSGLQYEVLTEGTGKKPKATDTVRCHYEGRLLDGTIFDSSYKRPCRLRLAAGHCRLDRRRATHVRRLQIPLLHPLHARLWRGWGRSLHPSLRHTHLRCGIDKGVVKKKM